MGIPSYFRHLTRTVRGLLTDTPGNVDWLCLDFNCMIYHVLQRPDMVIGGGVEWENAFLDEIARYALKVMRRVDAKKGVFLAVDGVVPMAKIRQQRMRRFKGVVPATPAIPKGVVPATPAIPKGVVPATPAIPKGVVPDTPATSKGSGMTDPAPQQQQKFSKNAITPGTNFMKRLGDRLLKMQADHKDIRIQLSLSNERGEGEHKVLNFIRNLDTPDNIVIYGLDADLIVLSMIAMLEKDIKRISLFREVIDRGEIQRDSLGEELFHFFSIDCLAEHLIVEKGEGSRDYLRDYCNAMMLLGNDFIPTSLTFRLQDDGHNELCDIIAEFRKTHESSDVETMLMYIIEHLAQKEEDQFVKVCNNLIKDVRRDCKEEEIFFESNNWRNTYYNVCLRGIERSKVVSEYWKGIHWVLDYYSGKQVDTNWVYAWHYPPLWADLLGGPWPGSLAMAGSLAVTEPLTDVEQLALVLPVESWDLLPPRCKERKLPLIAPEWFPVKFGLNKIGRKFEWEYEPDIPIPTVSELRARLSYYAA